MICELTLEEFMEQTKHTEIKENSPVNSKKKLEYLLLDESFAYDLLRIWSDEDVIRYTNIKEPCTLDIIMDRIKRLRDYDIFVVNNEGGTIGIIGCPCIDKSKKEYGLFYQFCKSSWGQGYATMAIEWLLSYMKRKYTDVTIFADVVVDNVASEKILKRYGFKFIGHGDIFERDGIKMKIHSYRLGAEYR